ncbi:putative phage tail assembly chaperone [Shewanella sp.]|uniref:putative phage tail assembly chaperone n=1 Tax=Shewanella sp. TaxID=50422 RepID=UPI003A97FAAB
MSQKIVLTAAGNDLSFTVDNEAYNALVNEMMPDNKVAPNHNFAMRTVDADSKEELKALFDKHPGAALQIGSALAAEFAPQLAITVKK